MHLPLPRSRRHRALETPFDPQWRDMLELDMFHWRLLNEDERATMEDLIRLLLVDKTWEAARGFELTEEIRLLISAEAALLILSLDYDYYRPVRSIIVHPTTAVIRGQKQTGVSGVVTDSPMPVLGEAVENGPVLIAWDAARREARHPERGHNVVYHEFAHKLDMATGGIDGTPPLRDRNLRRRWVEVCTREYEAVREGTAGRLLDPYAGINPGEFFAVATEVFFDRPSDMQRSKTELYEVLQGFYRQDPAERERRARSEGRLKGPAGHVRRTPRHLRPEARGGHSTS